MPISRIYTGWDDDDDEVTCVTRIRYYLKLSRLVSVAGRGVGVTKGARWRTVCAGPQPNTSIRGVSLLSISSRAMQNLYKEKR